MSQEARVKEHDKKIDAYCIPLIVSCLLSFASCLPPDSWLLILAYCLLIPYF